MSEETQDSTSHLRIRKELMAGLSSNNQCVRLKFQFDDKSVNEKSSKSAESDHSSCIAGRDSEMSVDATKAEENMQSPLAGGRKRLSNSKTSLDSASTSKGSPKGSVSTPSLGNDTPILTKRHKPDDTYIGSPWEVSRMKEDLLEANKNITLLKSEVKKLNSLRLEQEVVFRSQKERQFNELQSSEAKVKRLETHLQDVRARENACRQSMAEYKEKIRKLEDEMIKHKKDKSSEVEKLQSKIIELESSVKRLEDENKDVVKLQNELKKTKEELQFFTEKEKPLMDKANALAVSKGQIEILENKLQTAEMKIKELENDRENYTEVKKIVDKDMKKIQEYPFLERELEHLRDMNRSLRFQCQKKLLLEEAVTDLKSRNESLQKREEEYAKELCQYKRTENQLKNWITFAKQFCDGPSELMPEQMKEQIALYRGTIESQQVKIIDLRNKLSQMENEKELVNQELLKAGEGLENSKSSSVDMLSKLEEYKKRLQFVVKEKNILQLRVEMYEKNIDRTPRSDASANELLLRSKVSELENLVKDYKQHLNFLEERLDAREKGPDFEELKNKISALQCERNLLLSQVQELTKRKDELEVELEIRALKGDYNPRTTKILHFRNNPFDEMKEQHKNELTKLREECNHLKERVRVLEEGNISNVTQIVDERLQTCNPQEIIDLREQLQSAEVKMQRCKEIFGATSKEFRDVVYMLLGYKVDRLPNNQYRLTSMFAESEDDNILFKLTSAGTLQLLESPYQRTIVDLVEEHLVTRDNFPTFLAAVTQRLFASQTAV